MSAILSESINYCDADEKNIDMLYHGGGGGVWEIEEERSSESHRGPWAATAAGGEDEEECVYVGVGKSETSMEALSWTLNHMITSPSTLVYLIHVFPEIKHVPNPCKSLFSFITTLIIHSRSCVCISSGKLVFILKR